MITLKKEYQIESRERIKQSEEAIAAGEIDRDQTVQGLLELIAADIDVSGASLRRDLHTYGELRKLWADRINFNLYDKLLVDIVINPGNALNVYRKYKQGAQQ